MLKNLCPPKVSEVTASCNRPYLTKDTTQQKMPEGRWLTGWRGAWTTSHRIMAEGTGTCTWRKLLCGRGITLAPQGSQGQNQDLRTKSVRRGARRVSSGSTHTVWSHYQPQAPFLPSTGALPNVTRAFFCQHAGSNMTASWSIPSQSPRPVHCVDHQPQETGLLKFIQWTPARA